MQEKKQRKKRKLGSYPFASVVFSITVALLVMGIFGWMLLHSSRLGNKIQENIEIQVYLNKELSRSDINRIRGNIENQRYTLVKEKAQVELITREQAAEQFTRETGEDFTTFLGDNPLRDLLTVKILPEYQSVDSLRMIKKEIEKVSGVYEVDYQESLVESINKNLVRIGFLLIGVAIFSLLVVIILINNTIKLALFSQRFLIRSMQLVGATSAFIRRPFLYRSIFYGFLSGLLASAILYSFSIYMNSLIDGLAELQNMEGFIALFCGMIVIGMIVGYFSSLRAIRKYLKMSLDELY